MLPVRGTSCITNVIIYERDFKIALYNTARTWNDEREI